MYAGRLHRGRWLSYCPSWNCLSSTNCARLYSSLAGGLVVWVSELFAQTDTDAEDWVYNRQLLHRRAILYCAAWSLALCYGLVSLGLF